MVLSLFFSVTSALVSTLIRQWAREYLQYSQPAAAPHKRVRVRAYLFDGLSRFQMRRLTYGVPVLLHVSVFFFFYALSEWLYSINVAVGTRARYCFVALLAVYLALSVLPLIVRNAPYQTALTTPLQACVSLIQASYLILRWRLWRDYDELKKPGFFETLRFNRARALMKKVKKRRHQLDRIAMHWLLQELDEDDMDTFLSGLPEYIHSPLTNKKLVVENLIEEGVPGRITEHIKTCSESLELSQEESMSRATACISSLRLICETAENLRIIQTGLGRSDIRAILEHLRPYRRGSSTTLRALCIRCLVIREFLIPFVNLDAEEIQTKKFPNYLMPISRVISLWKTKEIALWSQRGFNDTLTATDYSLPADKNMWDDVVNDGPLINLAVLACGLLTHTSEGKLGDVDLDMAWKTLEILLKSLNLAQASALARDRFKDVLLKARTRNCRYEIERAQISTLLKTLDIVNSGLRLVEVFVYTPGPMLPPRQIEAIFGPEQLRNNELLEAFAAYLPKLVSASTPEVSQKFVERLILEDKLWEQLHFSLFRCLDPQGPFPDKLRIIMAFFDIFDVAFEVLKESSTIDWRSPDLDLLYRYLLEFQINLAPSMFIGRDVYFRSVVFRGQFCHGLLAQFSMQRSLGEPLMYHLLPSLSALVGLLGVGTQEDMEILKLGSARTGSNMMIKANATLDVILRDGPLSNFINLGRRIFKAIFFKPSDMTSSDAGKLRKLFERMLNTPHLQLANASAEKWATFDHFRGTVLEAAAMEGNSAYAEIFQPLLNMVEKIKGMRPADTDGPAEGTGNEDDQIHADGLAGPDAWQRCLALISGSSNQAKESCSVAEGLSHPALGTVATAGADQSTPHCRVPPGHSNLDLAVDNVPSTSLILTTQLTPGAKAFYFSHPHVPQAHPLRFAAPPGMSTPRRAASLDSANLQAYAHTRSVFTNIPVPRKRMLSLPHPSSPPSYSPLDGLRSRVNQCSVSPGWAGGCPALDSNRGDGM